MDLDFKKEAKMSEVDVKKYRRISMHIDCDNNTGRLVFYSDPNDGSGDLAIGVGGVGDNYENLNVVEFKNGVDQPHIAGMFFLSLGRSEMWRDVNRVIVKDEGE